MRPRRHSATDKGRPRRPWSKADREELKELRARGLTYRVIAHLTGRHFGSIAGKMRRLGLAEPRPRTPKPPRAPPTPRALPRLPPLEVLFANPADRRAGR